MINPQNSEKLKYQRFTISHTLHICIRRNTCETRQIRNTKKLEIQVILGRQGILGIQVSKEGINEGINEGKKYQEYKEYIEYQE